MILRSRPSPIITLHWILIIASIGLLLSYTENKTILYISISILLLTLIFNKVTYIKLKANSFTIVNNYFLLIPTSKFSININEINDLYLMNYKDIYISNSKKYVEFEAVIIVEIITGLFFYKPNYKLVIDLTQNKKIELKVNSYRKDVLKIITHLQEQISKRNNT